MGGKSRKSGGVSKKLIAQIKSGQLNTKTSSCGKKNTTEELKKDGFKPLFD
jgi:hypothetical protein